MAETLLGTEKPPEARVAEAFEEIKKRERK